ncbi:MAG: Nramp family divalent metal transporter [Candidatus Aminicenantes bacterium]|nr:Nramp family divalent metal transporter [Candidatus Aminicenantes bacterium]MCK4758609.1 Nramp family divalent metal transporter [Candidatus Aminicenantes bacterium]
MAKKNRKSSFGPGFLVTAAFIGPGTVTTCSLAGSNFGYALIFALVFATVTTIILQNMTGRLSLGSGHDLGQALREFPRSQVTRNIFLILTLFSITFGCAAYEAGNIIGGSLGLEAVTSVSSKVWVAVISLIAVFILGLGRYKFVEKFLIFLVFLMSVSFLTTLIIIKPDFLSILKGMVPTFPKNSLFLILALVGTTVVPYNLFLHSSAVKEKWSSVSDLKTVKKDLFLSITLGGIISVSIVVTSAVAFYKQGLTPENGIQLAQQLKPLFGTFTNVLFGLGFFTAGMSSALTAPYAAAFASSGIMGWKKGPDSKQFKAVWLGVILIGFVVSILNLKPLVVIVFAQAANGLVLPVASIFLLIVLNNRQKMGNLVNTAHQNIIGTLIILIVTCLGLWNIVKLFMK